MTKDELNKAADIAQSDTDLSNETDQIHIFDGFALPDFKPVYVTIEQVAALIRWQCVLLNGAGFNADAFDEVARIGKRKFIVVG